MLRRCRQLCVALKPLTRPGINSLEQRSALSLSPLCAKQLSDFQLKKITEEFDHLYDRNGDGFVDSLDVDYFKRRLRGYLSQTRTPSEQDQYIVGYNEYWSLLRDFADTNKDGELSREEWVELWTGIISGAKGVDFHSLPQWVQLMPRSLFPLMDTKADGVLDPEEYRNFWEEVGSYPPIEDSHLTECFDVMTEGGKHPLNVQRMEELYADFYLSDDPSTPGKYVAGPMKFD